MNLSVSDRHCARREGPSRIEMIDIDSGIFGLTRAGGLICTSMRVPWVDVAMVAVAGNVDVCGLGGGDM